jgi:hypothetical protein
MQRKIQGSSKGALIFETIPEIKPSAIASGATTIGSAWRAPDHIIEQNKQLREGCKEKTKEFTLAYTRKDFSV